jgi:hypothetical protein
MSFDDEGNELFRYNPEEFEIRYKSASSRINLAESMEDIGLLLLIALFSSANYPMPVSESIVHQEISQLADAGRFDELALKGLKWIQEISND